MDFETPAPVSPDPLADLEPAPAPARRSRGPMIGIVAVVAIVAVVVAAVTLTGGSKTKSAIAVLSEARSRTTAAGTAHVALQATETVDGQSMKILDATGVEDFGARSGALTMHAGDATTEVRGIAGVSYLSVPTVTLPRGAHWISITPADLKIDPKALAIGSTNPSDGLQFLSAVNGAPRTVGREKVDGVEVTHYAFTLDLKNLFQQVGAAASSLRNSSMGSAIAALGSIIDLSSVPGAAWIDADGRVRRFTLTIDLTVEGHHVKAVDDFQFSRFDEPVVVEKPPASDTIDLADDPGVLDLIARAEAPSPTA